jgi:hypothetical protein
MGVARWMMYYHLSQAGLSTAQKPFTVIDDDLDEHISAISLLHPFAGMAIIAGHLEGMDIHLPVQMMLVSSPRSV